MNESELLEFARHGTTAHVERLVRAWRQVDRNEAAELEAAPDDLHVSAETFRRLSCDATTVRMEHDERGRVLEYRDGTCRFPGCAVRHTDAHHVRHWAEGGETKLSNMLSLCRFHHRAVHEGGRAPAVGGSIARRGPWNAS